MKNITIDFHGRPADYLLLESMDDVAMYAEHNQRDVQVAAHRILTSNLPNDRLDHLASNDVAGGMIAAANYRSRMAGKSTLMNLVPMAQDKLDRIATHILSGERVMVNEVGGYCFLSFQKVLSSTPISKITREPTHVIKGGTKWINLENDANLEQHTIDHLTPLDPNFSYVTELRNYSQVELTAALKAFRSKGGSHCYVYTTGLDIPQIKMYCEALKDAGIEHIDFEFNAGISDELHDLMEDIDMRVKYASSS